MASAPLANQSSMENKHRFYMNIAWQIATASYAQRNKVGALLERDHNIIAFGYNGTPHGFDNACEVGSDPLTRITKPEVLHAESNAIAKCAVQGTSSLGATLYVTVSPCLECAKLIIQARIALVIYDQKYRTIEGIHLLEKAGIPCININEEL